jgi:hypothetical protein
MAAACNATWPDAAGSFISPRSGCSGVALYYIENWSVLLDLYIIALVPLRLFTSENAY